MNNSQYFDALETRDPQVREGDLFRALPDFIARARERAQSVGRRLADIDPGGITDRGALAGMPVLRKSELLEQQKTLLFMLPHLIIY